MKKIELDGANNVRDFGDTINQRGQRIKEKRFLRGNALDSLSEKDMGILRNQYHLSCVIDLRTDEEIAEKPDVEMESVQWLHIPVLKGSTIGITREEGTGKQTMDLNALPDMLEVYNHMVTDPFSVGQLKKVFQRVMADCDGSVLWHCTAGKDRCGIVSALFLSLLDVEMDVILKDYLVTNEVAIHQAKEYGKLVEQHTGSAVLAEKVQKIFVADEAYLRAAVEAIQGAWGSCEGFIHKELGISHDAKKAFQEKVLA